MFEQERLFKKNFRLYQRLEVFDDLWLVCKLYFETTLMVQYVVLCVTGYGLHKTIRINFCKLSFIITFTYFKD